MEAFQKKQKTMENHIFSWVNQLTIEWWFMVIDGD